MKASKIASWRGGAHHFARAGERLPLDLLPGEEFGGLEAVPAKWEQESESRTGPGKNFTEMIL